MRSGLVAAAITAGAGLYAANADRPAEPPQVAARADQSPREHARLELPAARELGPRGGDLFRTPPPPPPPPRVEYQPEPPPPPVAPALPFTFLGTFEAEGGDTVFYLGEADKLHVVKLGETVNGVYRVEAVASDQMELVYLPLAIKQTLILGSKK